MSRQNGAEIDPGLRGWLYRYAKKNYWRVAGFLEYEDLVQEGWVVYAVCLERYGAIKERKHFMALFKRAYSNRIHDLATKRTRRLEKAVSELVAPGKEAQLLESLMGYEHELGTLLCLAQQAPDEIKALLDLLFTDGGLEQLRTAFQRNEGVRETNNQRFCRLLGLDGDSMDLVGALRRHFAA